MMVKIPLTIRVNNDYVVMTFDNGEYEAVKSANGWGGGDQIPYFTMRAMRGGLIDYLHNIGHKDPRSATFEMFDIDWPNS
jgi:hypothetical protein